MIRILIADDHVLIREGLKKLLKSEPDITILGEATTAAETLDAVTNTPLDVLILDMNMPGRSGLDLLRDLRTVKPDLRVLVLTIHPEDSLAVRALRSGASGYITKESAPGDLIVAIRKVAGGGRYISPSLAERLVDALDPKSDRPLHEALSDREYQVFVHIARGRSVSDIAQSLSLSVPTVSTYRARLLKKMHMESNAELIHYALKNHLIEGS
jgi:two-component system, NarL family, invasion response regulator UvrY